MLNWIWSLCNKAFESGVVPENWGSVMIVLLYKGKRERTESSNYGGISLSVVGKIYTGILVDRIHNMTEGLIDDEQGRVQSKEGV